MKGNHTAMSPIDNLCYQLGKILNDYMSSVEIQTGKVYRQWPDILDMVIIEMNEIRKRELPDKNEFDTRFVNDTREIRKISFNKKLGKRQKLLKKSLLDLNLELGNQFMYY